MRDKMPATAAFVDRLRAAWGRDLVDQAIRDGLREGTFWAVESGHVVGDPPPEVLERWGIERPLP